MCACPMFDVCTCKCVCVCVCVCVCMLDVIGDQALCVGSFPNFQSLFVSFVL